MSVAIIGGGISGEAMRRALERRGTTTRLLSRSTGFNVLKDDSELALDGVEAVVVLCQRRVLLRLRGRRLRNG